MLKIIISKNKNIPQILVSIFIILILIKLPPLYIFPGGYRFLTTHTLAKTLIFFNIVLILFKEQKLVKKITLNKTSLLIILFLLQQSLSIMNATDVYLFLKQYQNLLSAIFLFILGYFIFIKELISYDKFFKFCFILGVGLVILEAIYIVFNTAIINFLNLFVQKEVLISYLTDIGRGRYFLYTNYEAFLPIFLFGGLIYFKNHNKIWQFFSIIVSLTIVFLSVFSNYRRPVLVIVFCLVSFILIFHYNKPLRKVRFRLLTFLIILPLFIYIAISISNSRFTFNVFDRFLLTDKSEDLYSISFREESFYRSMEIAEKYPLLGAGLGQYETFVKVPASLYRSSSRNQIRKFIIDATKNPHSVISRTLAESGFLGLSIFTFMMMFFLIKDIFTILKNPASYLSPFIIIFWALFINALFSPFDTIFFIGWFWFLRGIIEAYY